MNQIEFMRYKKFFLIPVILIALTIIYSSVVNSLEDIVVTVRQDSEASKQNKIGGEVIGVGDAVSVKVTRATKPYLLGLVNLPAYANGVGNLTVMHTIFFWFLGILGVLLTGSFIIIERSGVNMVKFQSPKPGFSSQSIWLRLLRSAGIGVLFALIAFILSNDPSSIVLGLLVGYLEFRLV